MKKVGRPKVEKIPEKVNINDFREDIQMFKNSLIDAKDDEDYFRYKETIEKFLALPNDQQNIFIAYLIEGVTITKLAQILMCNKLDLFRIITKTKKELRK